MFKLFTIAARTLPPESLFFRPDQPGVVKALSVNTPKDQTTIHYQEESGVTGSLLLRHDTPVKLSAPYTRVHPAYTPVELAALQLLDSINTSGGILTDENDNPVGLSSDPENLDLAVDADALCRSLRDSYVMEACLLRQVATPDEFDADEDE